MLVYQIQAVVFFFLNHLNKKINVLKKDCLLLPLKKKSTKYSVSNLTHTVFFSGWLHSQQIEHSYHDLHSVIEVILDLPVYGAYLNKPQYNYRQLKSNQIKFKFMVNKPASSNIFKDTYRQFLHTEKNTQHALKNLGPSIFLLAMKYV